ncbi:MAG TPA: hypothetical protein GXZ96_02150 [Firmicutes bacterium]|jgi:hypothetical protein|nr:hypothetical protein [Bacillota bacterium]
MANAEDPDSTNDIAAERIKTMLSSTTEPGVSEELVELFLKYQFENWHQLCEWRLLPAFNSEQAPDWDQLTQFVFVMSDQVQRDDNGIYTLTAQAFEKEVDRFFWELEYAHRSSTFLWYSLGIYTPTGWDITGATYYRLKALAKTGEDSYTATLDGFPFWEGDDFRYPDSVSKNMRAVINYLGAEIAGAKFEDNLIEILRRPDYSEILQRAEQLEITFKLSPHPGHVFVYLSCQRSSIE